MTRFEDYDERDLADIVFDEIPFVKDAYQEYIKDREEYANEEYGGFSGREQRYDFSFSNIQ